MTTGEGTEELAGFGYQQELKRSLRLRDLLLYGLIFMVPIAPFPVRGGPGRLTGGRQGDPHLAVPGRGVVHRADLPGRAAGARGLITRRCGHRPVADAG
jgi:hypothetical protein